MLHQYLLRKSEAFKDWEPNEWELTALVMVTCGPILLLTLVYVLWAFAWTILQTPKNAFFGISNFIDPRPQGDIGGIGAKPSCEIPF